MGDSYRSTLEKKENLWKWFSSPKRKTSRLPQRLWEFIDKERVWKQLEDGGYVEEVLDSYSYTQEDLLDEAEEILLLKANQTFVSRFTQPPIIGETKPSDPSLQVEANIDSLVPDNYLRKRASAFTCYLLKLAAADRRVERFRQKVLNGGTVTYDEAVTLVDSPGAAIFSYDWFEDRGIPIVNHKAQVLEGKWPPSEVSSQVEGTIKIEWQGGEVLAPFKGVAPFLVQDVWLSDDERAAHLGSELLALEGSALGDLFKLSQQLNERFPWWGGRWMPMFVLMGRAPVIGLHQERYYQPYTTYYEHKKPIAQPRLYTPVTMEIPPWYSPETVSRVYKRIKESIPTAPVSTKRSARRIAVFEFVMKHPKVKVPGEGQIPELPPWVNLLRSWNESLPAGHQWQYNHRGNFRQDFLKAFNQIVNYYR